MAHRSRPFRPVLATLAAAAVCLCLVAPATRPATAQATLDGKALFEREGCQVCHSVSEVGIEATVKVASLRGPDLSEVEPREASLLVDYLRQKVEIDGVKHKKAFGGSDEELGALVAWLDEMAEGDE